MKSILSGSDCATVWTMCQAIPACKSNAACVFGCL
jgi:hypothetical protein